MTTPLQSIPRAAVLGSLRMMRLPLDAVAVVAHRDHSRAWAPTVAFEAFEAQVKGFAGAILRDDDLLSQSTTQQARVLQLRKAVDLESEATAQQAVADRELAERREAAEETKVSADQAREAEKQRLEADAAKTKQAARQRAASQKQSAKAAERAKKEAVAEKARAAKAETLAAKREALAERKQAAAARAAAREIGDAAKTTRERRKAATN